MVGRNAAGTCVQCCRDSSRRNAKKYALNNPNKVNWLNRESSWNQQGITNSNGSKFTCLDYDRLFDSQKGNCKLCGKHQFEFKISLAVDHDHETGFVRGLLCNNCNLSLARLDKLNMDKVIKYLTVVC